MSTKPTTPSASDIYQNLPAEKAAEVAEALDRYLKLVIRIGDGVLADPELADLVDALTSDPSHATVECRRSNIKNGKTSNV